MFVCVRVYVCVCVCVRARARAVQATLGALAVAVPVPSHEGGGTGDEGGRVGALKRLLSEARGIAGTGRRADMSIGIRAVEAMLACNAEVGVQSQVGVILLSAPYLVSMI